MTNFMRHTKYVPQIGPQKRRKRLKRVAITKHAQKVMMMEFAGTRRVQHDTPTGMAIITQKLKDALS